jgi:hypothetical protein
MDYDGQQLLLSELKDVRSLQKVSRLTHEKVSAFPRQSRQTMSVPE